MAFIPVEHCVQAQMIFDYNGSRVQNVLHFDVGETPNEDHLDTIAGSLSSWWTTNLKGYLHSSNKLDKIVCTILETQNSMAKEFSQGSSGVGTNSNTNAPANVTAVVSLKTNYRGRSYRGRIYHVGLVASSYVGNVLTSATISDLYTNYLLLLDLSALDDFQLVVVSRYTDNAPRTSGIMTPVNAIIIDGNVDSQRRRLAGRGS